MPHAGFDRQPSGDRWRQNFVAIVLGLLFKQFDAGHRHDSRRHAVFLQLLTTFESEPNFGAGSNQDQLGIDPVATALGTDTVRFSQHVSTLAQAFSRSELLSINQRHLLSRQRQRCRRFASQDRQPPGFAHLVHVGGSNDEQVRNSAQSGQMFDRLVRRSIFAQAHRIVSEDVDNLNFRKTSEPNRWAHVIRETHERAAVRNQSAIQRHARHRRTHAMFANTPMNDAPIVTAGFEIAAVFDVGVIRHAKIG